LLAILQPRYRVIDSEGERVTWEAAMLALDPRVTRRPITVAEFRAWAKLAF